MAYSEKVKAFFDKQSKKFTSLDYLHPSLAGSLELKTFLKFLDLPPGSKLLDLGCGTGRYTIPLMYLGYAVTGVDISRSLLDMLRTYAIREELIGELETFESDFREKVFEEVFDGAYCISTFHLLGKTIAEREKIFYNMFLAVKKGGVILVMQPNPYNLFFYPFYLFHPDVSWDLEKNFMRCSPEYLYNFFRILGLKDIRIKRYGMLPTRLINSAPNINEINNIMCDMPILKRFSLFILIKGIKT